MHGIQRTICLPFTLFAASQQHCSFHYMELKRKCSLLPCSNSCDHNSSLSFSDFQSCPATRVAALVSFQMGSVKAPDTTSETRSDTTVNPALCWKVTAFSPALYHLAVEHSGTSLHHFVEVRRLPLWLSFCWGHENWRTLRGREPNWDGEPGMLINEADGAWNVRAEPFRCFISVQEKQMSLCVMNEQLF